MKILRDIGTRLLSLYCWTATYTWMITSTLLLLPLFLLVGAERGHWIVVRPALGWCIPLTLIRVKKHLHKDYDPEVRGIILQNHVSVLDGHMATYNMPHRFCGLFNSWHFFVPGYGWLMALSKGIGVPSSKEGRAAALGAAVKDRVRTHGISVLTFPEGHRTMTGRIGQFRRGAFFMARDAGVPVIPMYQRGMFELQNKTDWRFRTPGTVDLYFGRPIETAGLTDEQIGELAEHCQLIAEMWVHDGELPQGEGFPDPPTAIAQ